MKASTRVDSLSIRTIGHLKATCFGGPIMNRVEVRSPSF